MTDYHESPAMRATMFSRIEELQAQVERAEKLAQERWVYGNELVAKRNAMEDAIYAFLMQADVHTGVGGHYSFCPDRIHMKPLIEAIGFSRPLPGREG